MPERLPEFLTIQQAAALTRLSRAVFEPYESKAQPGMVEFDGTLKISVDPDPYPWPSSSAVPIPLPVNDDVEVPVA